MPSPPPQIVWDTPNPTGWRLVSVSHQEASGGREKCSSGLFSLPLQKVRRGLALTVCGHLSPLLEASSSPGTVVLSLTLELGRKVLKMIGAWVSPSRFCLGWRHTAGRVIPVAMKRCVASRSCGETFTLISESESLNKEKSCRLLSRCGTLCFFRLSAVDHRGQTAAISESLLVFGGFPRAMGDRQILWDRLDFCSVNCRYYYTSPREWKDADQGQKVRDAIIVSVLFTLRWCVVEKGKGGLGPPRSGFLSWSPYLWAVQPL